MNESRVLTASLLMSGALLLAVGGALLLAPDIMHASNGVDIGSDPSLRSEVRAPGGALLALGGLILAGVFVKRLRFTGTVTAATVYLAYGLSRLLSMAIDGMPSPGLVVVTGVEIVIGIVNVVLLAGLQGAGRRWT